MFLGKKNIEIMQKEITEAFIARIDKHRKERRRRIFEQVALNDISQNERYWANQAERVIKAADEFAEKEIEK